MHSFFCFNVLYVLQITSVSLVLFQQHNINHQVGKNDDKPFSSLALVSFCAAQQIFLSEAFLYHVQPHFALLLTELSSVLFLPICLSQLPKGEKKSLWMPSHNSRQTKIKLPCYLLDSIKCQSVFPTLHDLN